MTELEYYKELARLWEVSSFDFRAKTGNSFEDGPTHKAAVAYAARKNELVGIKITGSALDLQLKEALISNGGPWKSPEYKPGQEFVNATLGVPHDEQLDLEPNAAVDALNAIAELCGVKEWDYPGQVVRDVRLKIEQLPYPENRGKTHYEGCFRQRDHHNCAVRRINDLTAENIMCRRTNKALREQIQGESDEHSVSTPVAGRLATDEEKQES